MATLLVNWLKENYFLMLMKNPVFIESSYFGKESITTNFYDTSILLQFQQAKEIKKRHNKVES